MGFSVGGLFSPEYMRAPWSFDKFLDLLAHLPLPIIIIGTAGTAGLIRVMRASLLDELGKQYVVTARAKGVGEQKLLFKYPFRVALNPIISTIGWLLPFIVSGGVIVELVLNLPTTGPMLYGALLTEDMFLASSSSRISRTDSAAAPRSFRATRGTSRGARPPCPAW
jgi:peptide/nickel transport system permease protein